MSFQNLDDHGFSQFPFLYYLWIFMTSWKWYGIVSRCLQHGFEFTIFLLLDWLPSKDRNPCLPCNLTSSSRNTLIYFLRALARKWMYSDSTWTETRLAILKIISFKCFSDYLCFFCCQCSVLVNSFFCVQSV